jgi:hypothetical protein
MGTEGYELNMEFRADSVCWGIKEFYRKVRIVYKVIKRTILADGQILLILNIEVQMWWTSLELSENKIIGLYKGMAPVSSFTAKSRWIWIWKAFRLLSLL